MKKLADPPDVDRGVLEVVVNHPELAPDENSVGHIIFSPRQARTFARLLLKHAKEASREWRESLPARQGL